MDENENTEVNQKAENQPKKSSALMLGGIALAVILLVGGILMAGSRSRQDVNETVNNETTGSSEDATAMRLPDSEVEDTEVIEDDEPEVTAELTPSASADQSNITVEGGTYYFKPDTIRVKKGQPVKITFKNAGGIHDFVIEEFDVQSKQLQSGASEIIEFTPDKTGSFEYYCSVGNHRQMGMKGTLIVE